MQRDVLTFILAGGRGQRLDPLTRDRAKPAVPFGGIYRIIDFTLSNCVNSGLRKIYVLTQYKSFSLQRHLLSGWNVVSTQLGEFIDVIPAQQRTGEDWYRGTADAIFQNIYTINDIDPELVLILAGDHVYKMDYAQMLKAHLENKADVTVACVAAPKEFAGELGVVEVDGKNRVKGFQEKPKDPKVIPTDKESVFASMGIYLFDRKSLVDALEADAQTAESRHDFGRDVIPQLLSRKKRVFVFNFQDESGTPRYWRDIGTRDAYYRANMDLLDDGSGFDLYDDSWPVRTLPEPYRPVRMIATKSGPGTVINSLISGGCVIKGGYVEHSVLSPNVFVGNQADVRRSVLMDDVVIEDGAKVQNAIIDKDVRVPSGVTIGYDPSEDRRRFVLTSAGVVIVPKRTVIEN